MTTVAAPNFLRSQTDPASSAYAQDTVRKPFAVQPERSAENPFEAANGTLHFSNERKAQAQAARSGAARSTTSGSGRSASTSRSSASQRSSASGGSKQPPKKRKRRSKKKTRRLILFASIFLLFSVLVLIGAVVLLNFFACGGRERCENVTPAMTDEPTPNETPVSTLEETVIVPNVTIENVGVQNLSVGEARKRVTDAVEQIKRSVLITVTYEQYSATLNADEIGLDYTESLNDALLKAAQSESAQTLRLAPSIDPELLRTSLNKLNEQIPSHAVNAKPEVKFKTNQIDGVNYYQPYWDFTEGENGAKIDADALERQIFDALNAGNYTAELTPTVTVSEPEITVEKLQEQYSKLSSYTTNYRFKGSSSTDAATAENCMARDANITKAIGTMQVVELKPGKSWSFNKATGERSEKKGWALANAVYQGSGYRKEPGGGVCQVSTTIFNALLRAGVTDINRRGHSIPSDYVTDKFVDGLGFDATVDYGHIDFSFKNNTGKTIYMFVYITKNKESGRRKNINVEIYGQKEEGVEYRCRNEILEMTPADDETKYEYEVDKTMLASAKPIQIRNAHDGYRVQTYVDKYVNGSFQRCVYTELSIYKVTYPKFRIGSAVITPAPTNTPKPTATPAQEEDPVEEP